MIREGSKPTCSYSSRTHVWAGLHYSPDSFLGATTAHSTSHMPMHGSLRSFCGEQTCTMRSSAPLLPHYSANSLGRCVWPQPSHQDCGDQVQGVVRGCRCAVLTSKDAGSFFLPSVTETADHERNIECGICSSAFVEQAPFHLSAGSGDSWWRHGEVDRAQMQ